MATYFRSFQSTLSRGLLRLALAIGAAIILEGCGTPGPISPDEWAAFDNAGPVRPVVDTEHLQRARLTANTQYLIVPGDVLAVTLPENIAAGAADGLGKGETYMLRVDAEGNIGLPLVGKIKTSGKTLDAAEEAVVSAYFPKYTTRRPWVSIKVGEYATFPVTVLGAVKTPGIYALKTDEMSLVTALMKAGWTGNDSAAVIRIRSADGAAKPVTLPVKGLGIPFADVALAAGDTIELEQRPAEEFTVIGLVNRPGIFPYPPTARYTLMQAIASGGGYNTAADPWYAKIYRQTADGKLVALSFDLRNQGDKKAALITIKPGDVVAVEDTPYTWTRVVLVQILHLYAGATIPTH
jgi:protein involved in polysaccharide export with SLBB domain